ncbi:twin-arginine translocation signal domain-containing protein, partial [Pseudomonas aeruginosa]
MKRSYPDDLVIGNLSRRGFLKGVGATGSACRWAVSSPSAPVRCR